MKKKDIRVSKIVELAVNLLHAKKQGKSLKGIFFTRIFTKPFMHSMQNTKIPWNQFGQNYEFITEAKQT